MPVRINAFPDLVIKHVSPAFEHEHPQTPKNSFGVSSSFHWKPSGFASETPSLKNTYTIFELIIETYYNKK